jgi:hypothetical protein
MADTIEGVHMAEVVHMLQNIAGSPNGLDVYTYHKGEKYTVGDPKMSESLALAFVENGSAELVAGKASGDGDGKVLPPSQETPKQSSTTRKT